MNDPERLLHGSPDGLSARLLRAGIDEAPAPRSLERTLVALGAASATLGAAASAGALSAVSTSGALGAAGAGKAVTTLTLVSLAKWAGIGVASGVLVSLGARVVQEAPRTTPAGAPVERAVPAPGMHERLVPVPELPSPSLSASATAPPRAAAAPTVASRLVDERASAPLAAEVTFVDRGRVLFQHGDARGALDALSAYEQRFPEQRLLPEVLYLRMEALSRTGDTMRAGDVARRLVRDFGKGPHAARARALLSGG